MADLSFSSWPAALCLNGHAWRRFYNGEREERWLKQEADGGGRVGKLRPTQLYYGEPTVRPAPSRARDRGVSLLLAALGIIDHAQRGGRSRLLRRLSWSHLPLSSQTPACPAHLHF